MTQSCVTQSCVALRILSDKQPFADAKPANPTLEDYYLYVFGQQ